MRRLACLIGNNNYVYWDSLSCAVNDALKMERALKKCGFDTILHKDLGMNDLEEAIKSFEYGLLSYDAGLLFFAGHGVEIEGRQYLVPTNCQRPDTSGFDMNLYDTTPLVQLFSKCTANEENFAGIIVLDCCRSRRTKLSADRGSLHASQLAAKGVYIAFATEPGGIAKEIGEHGLFTLSLCNAIEHYGSEKVEDVFKYVRKEVVKECGEQIPWDNSSLLGDFYFQDTVALLKKSEAQGKDLLSIDFLREMLDDALSYTQIKDRIYTQTKEVNATLSQKDELLKEVLNQMDNLYISK